jgi:serine protease Do
VIGINTAFLTQTGGYMGIGFAIPINMATIIAERLQKDGKMTRAWLGAVLKDASTDDLLTRQHLTTTNAALISRIRDNSPAANSSLQEKDLIVSINDINIAGAADLRNRIALSAPGTTITLQFIRNGQKLSTSVVLGAKEEAGEN